MAGLDQGVDIGRFGDPRPGTITVVVWSVTKAMVAAVATTVTTVLFSLLAYGAPLDGAHLGQLRIVGVVALLVSVIGVARWGVVTISPLEGTWQRRSGWRKGAVTPLSSPWSVSIVPSSMRLDLHVRSGDQTTVVIRSVLLAVDRRIGLLPSIALNLKLVRQAL